MIGLVTAPETPNGLRLGAVCCLADASYSQVRLERDDAINDRACRADSEKRRRSRILTRLDLPVFTKRWSIFFRAQLIPCYVLAFGKERIRHAPGREGHATADDRDPNTPARQAQYRGREPRGGRRAHQASSSPGGGPTKIFAPDLAHNLLKRLNSDGRGRDSNCSLPPAQIPACGFVG